MATGTDWTKYYTTPYKTATFTRKITGRILIATIKKYINENEPLKLTELGGANSAFLELIVDQICPREYVIIDNNKTGLEKTKERIPENCKIQLLQEDILNNRLKTSDSDLVLSIGLIEHFDHVGTARAIRAHFDLLKPGGIAIITFPTPTFLYRFSRFIAEMIGVWIFHDERPLNFQEVLEAAIQSGKLLEQRVIWSIIFTQGVVVLRKI